MKHVLRPFAVIAFALLAACSSDTSDRGPYAASKEARSQAKGAAVVLKAPVPVTADSFGCIRELTPVRGFYVGNLLGDVADTLAAASRPLDAKWPVGSVVQRIPSEAMVKHGKGFNPESHDWEFFDLDVRRNSTKIRTRGFKNVVNQLGGDCLTCHSRADKRWDMICEQGHGCDSNLINPVMARALQNSDPRCPKVELPADQKVALKQLERLLRR